MGCRCRPLAQPVVTCKVCCFSPCCRQRLWGHPSSLLPPAEPGKTGLPPRPTASPPGTSLRKTAPSHACCNKKKSDRETVSEEGMKLPFPCTLNSEWRKQGDGRKEGRKVKWDCSAKFQPQVWGDLGGLGEIFYKSLWSLMSSGRERGSGWLLSGLWVLEQKQSDEQRWFSLFQISPPWLPLP